jgi:hypothetical protein
MSLVEYIKENFCEPCQEKLGREFHEDHLDDQVFFSSHGLLMRKKSDSDEKFEASENFIATLQEDFSIYEYALHLILEETTCNNDVHLHEDIPKAIVMDFEEYMGLVSYIPFQNFKFDDESLDDLKRIDLVEKPLEDE